MRDLSLHLLDIAQNSIRAGARHLEIQIEADAGQDMLRIIVSDDGCGMSPELLEQVTDPFVTTRKTRSVGLGLPLLRELCDIAGGDFKIESEPGSGTQLWVSFEISNIDRLPLGDLGQTLIALVMTDPSIDLSLGLSAGDRKDCLKTLDLRQTLEEIPLDSPEVLNWIKSCVQEMQHEIFGGILHEING